MDDVYCYTYDAENRLSSVAPETAPGSGVCGATSMSYLYDPEGRRVARLQNGAVVKQYCYDAAGHMITEADPQGNTLRAEIYAGSRHLATWTNNATYFNHADWLGTERVRSIGSGQQAGQPCETITSLPFGDGLVTSGACANPEPTPNHFTGKERDTETGLDNFGKRYFGSNMGRFMSPDPIGIMKQKLRDPQQWNMYSYARNNPLRFMDPTGMYVTSCASNDKACNKNAENFEKARQRDLNSKDSVVVAAAKAYGDPNQRNGVTVTFAQTLPGGCDGGSGCVQPGITGTATGITADVKVTFLNNLGGKSLDEAVAHEGSHTADALQFINSFDASTGKFNGVFNYVHYDTEFKAYAIGASVMKGENYTQGTCGGSPCSFGANDSIQDTYRKIDQMLTDPQNRYKPDLEKLQFDPAIYPQ